MVILQALWTERWKRMHVGNPAQGKSADESRDARLLYIAQVVGHIVDSAKDLTPAELGKVIAHLKSERPSRGSRSGNVVAFPNRNRITDKQVWKIRQIENFLGWDRVPERLEGFLLKWYRVRRPEHLSFRQAISAINGLFNLAATEAVKARLGQTHEVTDVEKRAEVQRIKDALEHWQPSQETAGTPARSFLR